MSDQDTRAPASTPDEGEKAELRQWVDRWKRVGPLLDEERWTRLVGKSDDELKREALDLLALWQPNVTGDEGEAIVLHQRVFALLGERNRA